MTLVKKPHLLVGALIISLAWPAAAGQAPDITAGLGSPSSGRRIAIKPSASLFVPSDERTRSRFGDSWTSLGISAGFRDEARQRNRVEFRADSIFRNSGDNHLYVVPLGVSLKHRFSTRERVSPYAGAGVYACPMILKCPADSVDTGLEVIGGASVFLGTDLGSSVKIEAGYYRFSQIEGFDLSGFKACATVSF